jgi:hypothetical protein
LEIDNYAFYIAFAAFLWLILDFKLSNALLSAFAFWFVTSTFIVVANNYDRKQFFGPGELADSFTYLALPYTFVGNSASVARFLDAALTENGAYSCDHVKRVDGGSTIVSVYSSVDEDLSGIACCRHNFDTGGWLAPYKVVDDKLHMLCGTFPYTQEVVTELPDEFIK